jgi:hypothetical protein
MQPVNFVIKAYGIALEQRPQALSFTVNGVRANPTSAFQNEKSPEFQRIRGFFEKNGE